MHVRRGAQLDRTPNSAHTCGEWTAQLTGQGQGEVVTALVPCAKRIGGERKQRVVCVSGLFACARPGLGRGAWGWGSIWG